jgi:hypothetical protein
MSRLFGVVNYLRVVGAFALVSTSFFLASLDPFLRAAPIAGSAASERTPPVSVNRYHKGDRLPIVKSNLHGLNGSQAREKVPVGCDPAFSPVASPALATVYGRCMT